MSYSGIRYLPILARGVTDRMEISGTSFTDAENNFARGGPGLRIPITLRRIRIRIRIHLFTLMRIRTLLLVKVVRIYDHWSTDLQGSILSLHASIVSVQCPPWIHFESLKLRIQLFTSMRIRIPLFKIMRIRNLGVTTSFDA